MSQELHPFWRGVQDEFKKEGFLDAVTGTLGSTVEALGPYGTAAGAGLAGIGAIALGRKLRLPLFHKKLKPSAAQAAAAAEEPVRKGFGWKGLGAAAGAGALGGAYMARKKD